jgi:hypothetical protein
LTRLARIRGRDRAGNFDAERRNRGLAAHTVPLRAARFGSHEGVFARRRTSSVEARGIFGVAEALAGDHVRGRFGRRAARGTQMYRTKRSRTQKKPHRDYAIGLVVMDEAGQIRRNEAIVAAQPEVRIGELSMTRTFVNLIDLR